MCSFQNRLKQTRTKPGESHEHLQRDSSFPKNTGHVFRSQHSPIPILIPINLYHDFRRRFIEEKTRKDKVIREFCIQSKHDVLVNLSLSSLICTQCLTSTRIVLKFVRNVCFHDSKNVVYDSGKLLQSINNLSQPNDIFGLNLSKLVQMFSSNAFFNWQRMLCNVNSYFPCLVADQKTDECLIFGNETLMPKDVSSLFFEVIVWLSKFLKNVPNATLTEWEICRFVGIMAPFITICEWVACHGVTRVPYLLSIAECNFFIQDDHQACPYLSKCAKNQGLVCRCASVPRFPFNFQFKSVTHSISNESAHLQPNAIPAACERPPTVCQIGLSDRACSESNEKHLNLTASCAYHASTSCGQKNHVSSNANPQMHNPLANPPLFLKMQTVDDELLKSFLELHVWMRKMEQPTLSRDSLKDMDSSLMSRTLKQHFFKTFIINVLCEDKPELISSFSNFLQFGFLYVQKNPFFAQHYMNEMSRRVFQLFFRDVFYLKIFNTDFFLFQGLEFIKSVFP